MRRGSIGCRRSAEVNEVAIPLPNASVLAGRERRAAKEVKIEWFIKNVSDKVAMSFQKRMKMATHYLKDKVVRNISISVTKGKGPRGGRVVTGRSVAGEFPHADTKQLLRTIFQEVREISPGVIEGYVGTPQKYGLILETRMDRSFLVRTLNEELGILRSFMTGPII